MTSTSDDRDRHGCEEMDRDLLDRCTEVLHLLAQTLFFFLHLRDQKGQFYRNIPVIRKLTKLE